MDVDPDNGQAVDRRLVRYPEAYQTDHLEIVEHHPWDRFEDSDLAWSGFQVFRDLPANCRSVRVAYEEWYRQRNDGKNPPAGKYPATFANWHRKYNWRERAHAYDFELDRRTQLVVLEMRKQSIIKQAEAGDQLRDYGLHGLSLKTEEDWRKETAGSLAHMIEIGVKLERTAMGEPESFTGKSPHYLNGNDQQKTGKGADALSNEELKTLGRLARKMRGIEDPEEDDDDIL